MYDLHQTMLKWILHYFKLIFVINSTNSCDQGEIVDLRICVLAETDAKSNRVNKMNIDKTLAWLRIQN